MKTTRIIWGLLTMFGVSLAVFAQSNEEILKQADETRFIKADSHIFYFKVTQELFDSLTRTTTKTEAFLKVEEKKIAGNFRQRISFSAPESLKGTYYLIVGDEFLFWQPSLKTPDKDLPCKDEALKISGQQKLFGDASIGEAAGIEFDGKYEIKQRSEEKLNGKDTIKLTLLAKTKKVAYQNVLLWVDKKTFEPQRIDLFGLDTENPIKRVVYTKYAVFRDDRYVAQTVIEDLVFKNQKTTLDLTDIKIESLPDAAFDPNTFCK
jgi:hypothetical protein